MAGRTRQIVAPFRHEGDGLALSVRDFLDAVLHDGVPVGHFQRLGVADIDLHLPRTPFTFGTLDRNAGIVQTVADGAHDRLFLGCLEDVVILDIGGRRLQAMEAFCRDGVIAFVEQIKFQLGRTECPHVQCRQPDQLLLQDVARCMRDRPVLVVQHIRQHQRGAFQPWDMPQSRQVWSQNEIAIALRPARGRVARHRLHIDVVGQQVIAGMGFPMCAIEKELGMKAFAD